MRLDEVMLFIHNDVFCFMFLSSFEFIDHNFSFFREENFDLLLWEFWPFNQASSEFFDSWFAGGCFVACPFNFFEHNQRYKLYEKA